MNLLAPFSRAFEGVAIALDALRSNTVRAG